MQLGQRLGEGIDPRMFVQDYSGFTRAAEIQAQGMQNLGAAIGNVAGQVGDYFKQQGEKKKLIKKSDVQIDAALKLFPDLAPTLQGVRDQIRDENVPLDDRAAIADSVAGLINMGTNQMRFQSEQGMQQQRLGLERMQYETSASRAQRELDLKVSEQEQKNYAASAEAIGSLAALKSVEEKTGKKFVPDEISSSVNELAQSGQGQAAANLISKYSAGLDPAIKAEFQVKKSQTPVNINLPQGGTQQMVLNAEGVYEPIQVAGAAGPNDAGVLPDIELPLTATQPDGTPLTLNDVPRGAEKTQEIDINGKKFDVYIDKNSPPEPVDVFGVTLPGFETAPREQWTPSKKFLIPKQEEQRQTPTIGPGTVGYAPPKSAGMETIVENMPGGGTRLIQRPTGKEADETVTQEKKANVSQTLGNLASAVKSLDDMNAIVNPDKPATLNIPARLASTQVGQMAAGTVGTEPQNIRDQINMIKPSLISAIREATGMSAKAMDSNTELQFYLQQVGDETKSIYANLAAIDALDRQYGTRGAGKGIIDQMFSSNPELISRIRNQPKFQTKPIGGLLKPITPAAQSILDEYKK